MSTIVRDLCPFKHLKCVLKVALTHFLLQTNKSSIRGCVLIDAPTYCLLYISKSSNVKITDYASVYDTLLTK